MNPFTFVESVSWTKQDLLTGGDEKHYNAFLVNRALSYHLDAVLFANEMNCVPGAPVKWQYHFYLHSLARRKRFSKWGKKQEHLAIQAISRYFDYSYAQAEQALSALTEEQVLDMINIMEVKHGEGEST